MSSAAQRFYRDWYVEQEQGTGPDPATEATFQERVATALAVIGSSRKRVLDFGCGTGAAAEAFVNAGHDVFGVDISLTAVQLARARVPSARFEAVDSESALPFPDAQFDVCFCSEVIEHLLDVEGFVREVRRVLAANGHFLITTPYHGLAKNLVIAFTSFDRHFDPTAGHVRFFTKRTAARVLRDHGFTVATVSGIGRFWPVWKSMFIVARKDQ